MAEALTIEQEVQKNGSYTVNTHKWVFFASSLNDLKNTASRSVFLSRKSFGCLYGSKVFTAVK